MCVHVRICHNGRMEWNPLIICACPSTIINLSLLCIRHLSQIPHQMITCSEKNRQRLERKCVLCSQTREYFCCHIDPHCLGLRSLCWVPPKRTNRWSCPKLQLMSFWATRTCNPNHYAGLLGAFTKHHHTVYSNFHPLSGDAFLFTTDARQAFDHFPIRVDTSASFADHICVGNISIYQIFGF